MKMSKMNQDLIKAIIDNMSKEDAILKIAEAMANRDEEIDSLKDEIASMKYYE